jgi:hypothetical protein
MIALNPRPCRLCGMEWVCHGLTANWEVEHVLVREPGRALAGVIGVRAMVAS